MRKHLLARNIKKEKKIATDILNVFVLRVRGAQTWTYLKSLDARKRATDCWNLQINDGNKTLQMILPDCAFLVVTKFTHTHTKKKWKQTFCVVWSTYIQDKKKGCCGQKIKDRPKENARKFVFLFLYSREHNCTPPPPPRRTTIKPQKKKCCFRNVFFFICMATTTTEQVY